MDLVENVLKMLTVYMYLTGDMLQSQAVVTTVINVVAV
jgi:hypothetical protein